MTTIAPVDRIADRVSAVRERVERACRASGRDPSTVTLIAASKTRTPEEVAEAARAGISDFGENYVQEGAAKAAAAARLVPAMALTWHLIGHLQRNKVNAALEVFDVFHGIDSLRTLEALARRAVRPVPVFIEVNLAGEPTKHGLAPLDLPAFIERARALDTIDLRGLMAIPPQGPPAETRRWFALLRELAHANGLRHLSMGMTDDFESAIAEGATHIRVGRAIFGERMP